MDLLPDTWTERGGAIGAASIGLRFALWYWRRRSRQPTKMPVIDWLVRITLSEAALKLKVLELKVQEAENRMLEEENKRLRELLSETQTRLDSADSGGGSFDMPESSLLRSTRTTTGSNDATSTAPDGDQPSKPGSGIP